MMGETTIFEECIALGPWGGGTQLVVKDWIFMPDGFIKKITIGYGRVIDYITFQSDTQSSTIGTAGKIGCQNCDVICIQYPNEYLTSISGAIGIHEGSEVVMSLGFHRNRRQYGPFGSAGVTGFSYDGKGGMIVGFHGRFGKFIDSIGIYVMPKSLALYRNCKSDDKSGHKLLIMGLMPRGVGPWGASGGKRWDDGVFNHVKRVCVHLGKSCNVIYGVQFEYVKKDGKYFSSPVHGGGTDAEKTEQVDLDGVQEFLTGISGFYGPVEGFSGSQGITSIAFHTNKKMYGPYGKERGEAGYAYFTSTASPGKIVGFHGRKSDILIAIGVHMEYF
ncbi:unnamed protein product [Lactuca virosa]|uniref:Jacalin-type lectin domain-containing protein n=1 Tax=Lactuca virosa TaxID=75947 RepID=A0AAU9NYI7_9ASTR|nr:unnamed protein product [Lactuca virosa]